MKSQQQQEEEEQEEPVRRRLLAPRRRRLRCPFEFAYFSKNGPSHFRLRETMSATRSSDGTSTSSPSAPTSSSPSPPFAFFRSPADFSAYVRSLSGKQLAAAGAAAVSAPILIGAAWWLAEKSFNTVTPYQVRRSF